MKRLVLVLFVCLSVQIGAMSAPLVHLHADAEHDTNHHGGRLVHRHVEAHDTAAHHRGDFHADHSAEARHSPSVGAEAEPAPQFLGGVTAAPATTITTMAAPVAAFDTWSSQTVVPRHARASAPVPAPPDISLPSLRGPPR